MKNSRGIILVDIMIALSLSFLFIVIIFGSTQASRTIYIDAKIREQYLNDFDQGGFANTNRAYGNDFVETVFSSTTYSSTTDIRFSRINAINKDDISSDPLCSVDFSSKDVLGSYHYFSEYDSMKFPDFDSTDFISSKITLPISYSNKPTDFLVRNGIAYVSTDSSDIADEDLFIVDISDTNSAKILSSINTGPGISAIVLAHDRIFAAARSTANQLHIIKIVDLSNLILEEKFRLIPPYATATMPFANSIFYKNGLVYLGTEKWEGEEFRILDVSDLPQITELGGFEIGSMVNDISIHDYNAYVSSAGKNQLIKLNVKDPRNIILSGELSPSGYERQEGKISNIFEGGLAFGRTSGGYNVIKDHELFLLDEDRFISSSSINISGGIYGVIVDKNKIIFATRQFGKEIGITSRDLSSSTISFEAESPEKMTCDGDKIYVLSHMSPTIYQIKIK